MPIKCYLNQFKLTKTFKIKIYKKRKFEASLIVNLQPEIKDNKFNTADINNIKNKFKILF